jgi:hypothetical protein
VTAMPKNRRRAVRSWGATALAALGGAAVTAVALSNSSAVTSRPTGGSLPFFGPRTASGDGAQVDSTAYGLGSQWHVVNWGPGQLAAIPASGSYNTVDATGRTVKRIVVSSQANPDVASAASDNNMSYSDDSGATFLNTIHHSPSSALNLARLHNGQLMAIDFIPGAVDSNHTSITLRVRTSHDGAHWGLTNAPLTAPEGRTFGGIRVHRRIIELPDGTLIVPAYGTFAGSSRGYSAILQSTDGGRSWTYRSIIPASSTTGTNEVGWSYTSDGRLLAVLRTASSPNSLVHSYSGDEGKTWSDAVPLLGPDGKQVQGIYPDVVLQPNGTMLLATGRPDVRVLVSNDGSGRSWQVQDTVFANYPSTGGNGRFDGTSGNTTMENVGPSRSLLFFDQCAVYGCGMYNQQFGIDAEQVGVVTPGTGRIDVLTRLLDGSDRLTGTFAKTDKRFPERRPAGAFDGSSAYGAEARLQGSRSRPGQMVLELDRAYSVDRIGLMLGHGEPQSTQVLLSADGKAWSAPVVEAANRRDRSMKYADFAPQTARYVKVVAPAGSATVTELELYSTNVDTFENELPFSVPRGWTDGEHSWVVDVPDNAAYTDFGGYHSQTYLRLWDKWTDDNARVTRPTSSSGQLKARMMWGSGDFRTSFTVGTKGTSSNGNSVQPWDFRIRQGSPAVVEADNGSGWTKLGTLAGAVPLRTGLSVSITATPTSATVTVGDRSFTATMPTTAVTAVDSVVFTTGDPVEYGGEFQIDDFSVTSEPTDH